MKNGEERNARCSARPRVSETRPLPVMLLQVVYEHPCDSGTRQRLKRVRGLAEATRER